MSAPDPSDGDVYIVEWRKFVWGNEAIQPYYTVEIPMFVHTFDDGETVLLVCQDYLDDADEYDAEYARSYADCVPYDPAHDRIETLTPADD